MSAQQQTKAFDTLSLISLFAIVFLLPLIFLPSFVNSHITGKLTLLGIGLTLILASKIAKTLINRRLEITLSHFDLPIFFFALIYIVVTFLRTPNKMEAFFLPGTTSFVIAGTILYFSLTQLSAKLRQTVLTTLILSGILVNFIFTLSHTGVFAKLNVFPAFLNTSFTTFDGVLAQTIFTITLLLILLSQLASKPKNPTKGFFLVSLVLLTIGSFFSVNSLLPGKTLSPQLLGFKDSWVIMVDSIKEKPFLGSGPGNFVSAFARFKPLDINNTDQWNTLHATSRNLYFTIATETGLLGVLLIIIFLLYWIKVLRTTSNNLPQGSSIYLACLFLLLALVFFPTSSSLLVILFLLTGLASPAKKHLKLENKIVLLGTTLPLIIALAAFVFFGGSALAAENHYKNALSSPNAQYVFEELRKAIKASPYVDRYHLTFSQVNINLAANLFKKGQLSEDEQKSLNQLIDQGINQAKISVNLNPQRASNWEILANIYQSLTRIAKGADEFAYTAYQQAITLHPYNPIPRLSLGGLLYTQGRFQDAVRVLEMAALTKPDHANIRYNLSLSYREANQVDQAIEQLNTLLTLIEKDSKDYELVKALLDQLASRKKSEAPSGEELTAPVAPPKRPITPPLELPDTSAPPENPLPEATPTPTSTENPTPTPSI